MEQCQATTRGETPENIKESPWEWAILPGNWVVLCLVDSVAQPAAKSMMLYLGSGKKACVVRWQGLSKDFYFSFP